MRRSGNLQLSLATVCLLLPFNVVGGVPAAYKFQDWPNGRQGRYCSCCLNAGNEQRIRTTDDRICLAPM